MPLLNLSLKLIAKSLIVNWGTWNAGWFGWFVCVNWHGVLEGCRKISKLIVPIHKKGHRSEWTNYRGISLLNLPGSPGSGKIIEPKLDDTQCDFCRGRSTTEQISTLQQNFEKSWEHAKGLSTCFVDLGKVYGRVPREKLWGCCGSAVLMGASCWQSSNCILAQKIVSVSTELNHNRSALVLDSDNDECCHHSSSESISGSFKLRPAGQTQPAKSFHPATKHIVPIMKKYIYEKCVDLVESIISRNITQDVWPSNCCAIAMWSFPKNVKSPGLYELDRPAVTKLFLIAYHLWALYFHGVPPWKHLVPGKLILPSISFDQKFDNPVLTEMRHEQNGCEKL